MKGYRFNFPLYWFSASCLLLTAAHATTAIADEDEHGRPRRALTRDRDRDCLPDVIEEHLGTNPNRVDTERDGVSDGDRDGNDNRLPDKWDYQFGLFDSDDDGISDREEGIYGLDRFNPDTDDTDVPDRVKILYMNAPKKAKPYRAPRLKGCRGKPPVSPTPVATEPPATPTIKPTEVPATSTPRPTIVPSTPTVRPTMPPSTATPQPPSTATPQPTIAPSTPTPRATSTLTPRPTSTSTPRPTSTSTPRPTSTSTPRPTSTPLPTSTATPRPTTPPATPTPAGSFDANGNTTKFGIPAGLVGNISRGGTVWSSSCSNCHRSEFTGFSYSQLRTWTNASAMRSYNYTDQQVADVTAYLNRATP